MDTTFNYHISDTGRITMNVTKFLCAKTGWCLPFIKTLIGEAVVVSMDIDRPSLDIYQMPCRTCEHLRTTVESLHRQLFELQQIFCAFSSRLFQVHKTQLFFLIKLNMCNFIVILRKDHLDTCISLISLYILYFIG